MIDLRLVIQQYQNTTFTRSQLLSLLRDLFPKEKRYINLTMTVFDSGIAARIRDVDFIDRRRMKIWVDMLMDEFGLRKSIAEIGIEMWAYAYDKKIESGEDDDDEETTDTASETAQKQAEPKNNNISAAAPFVVDDNNISDYILVDAGGKGHVILKFRGLGEPCTVIPNFISGKRVIGVGEDAYKTCIRIEQLEISEGIRFIDRGAFSGCVNLEQIIFPQTLEYIGSRAFDSCRSIKTLVFKEGLKAIDYAAFHNCDSLRSVFMPTSIKRIGGEIENDIFEIDHIKKTNPYLIIYGYSGSYSYEYAKSKGYRVHDLKDNTI